MTALIWLTAPADMRTAVFVTPWLGSPPPQKALSKISAPFALQSAFFHSSEIEECISLPENIPREQAVCWDTSCSRRSPHWRLLRFLAGQSWNSSRCRTLIARHRQDR